MLRKKGTIKAYLQEITVALDSTSYEGVLDHVLAKIIPVVTSLRAHSQKTKDQSSIHPTPFVTKESFTPAENNGTQLRFYKVKTAGRIRTKFPMKCM